MPRKFQGPIKKVGEVNFVDHFLKGTEFEVAGSKDKTYSVEISDKGIMCSCQGFMFHAKCKHTTAIADMMSGIHTNVKAFIVA